MKDDKNTKPLREAKREQVDVEELKRRLLLKLPDDPDLIALFTHLDSKHEEVLLSKREDREERRLAGAHQRQLERADRERILSKGLHQPSLTVHDEEEGPVNAGGEPHRKNK